MRMLEGLRVIEMADGTVAAQVGQLLADFGAQVVMVERPGGAAVRERAAFPFWARGKQSIMLDIKDAADRNVVAGLAAQADIMIESFRPGVLDRLGLGQEALRKANPRLIHASVTGFGRQSPYADIPAYEGTVLAKLGTFHSFGKFSPTLDVPPYVSTPYASFAAAQTTLHAILTALHEREVSGAGQWVETNLAQAFMMLDTWTWIEYVLAQRWPDGVQLAGGYDELGRPRSPMALMLMMAMTADGGWMQFACVGDRLFRAQMKAMGLSWMFEDEEWAGLPALDSSDKMGRLWTHMLEASRGKTRAQWEEIFAQDQNVFAEALRRDAEILDHPQLAHDDNIVTLHNAERGAVRQPGPLVKASRTPAKVTRSAPRLDEHRDELLALAQQAPTAPVPAADPQRRALPLEGITILDLSTMFAAPFGPGQLTDLGARVFKIEPLAGDNIRHILSMPETGGTRVMQGKESLCVDIHSLEGAAIVRKIAARVDVVMQGYRAGVTARMGLDYESIRAINPDVIYVNAPGYGIDGPYGRKPAYAPSIACAAGITLANVGDSVPQRADLSLTELQDSARRLAAASAHTVAQADGLASLAVASAILLGIVARDRGAGGQELFTSMLNTNVHVMAPRAVTWSGAPKEPAVDAALRGLNALYRIYPAADGHVFLAAPTDAAWRRLAAAVGGGLADRPEFATATARQANDAALGAALETAFAAKPARQWEEMLLARDISCVVVERGALEDIVLGTPLGEQSGYVCQVTDPTWDEVPRQAPNIRFSRSLTQALPSVLAGQHSDRILAELGYDEGAIGALRAAGTIA